MNSLLFSYLLIKRNGVQEREEESKRLKQQRQTEEAEAKRLAIESARREEARIRKEIEEKELEEARAMLAEAEKRKGKKGKKAVGDGVSSTWSLFTLESQMWMNIGTQLIEVLFVFRFRPYCKDVNQSLVSCHENSVSVSHRLRSDWQVTLVSQIVCTNLHLLLVSIRNWL